LVETPSLLLPSFALYRSRKQNLAKTVSRKRGLVLQLPPPSNGSSASAYTLHSSLCTTSLSQSSSAVQLPSSPSLPLIHQSQTSPPPWLRLSIPFGRVKKVVQREGSSSSQRRRVSPRDWRVVRWQGGRDEREVTTSLCDICTESENRSVLLCSRTE
jgi:hypothetical protein